MKAEKIVCGAGAFTAAALTAQAELVTLDIEGHFDTPPPETSPFLSFIQQGTPYTAQYVFDTTTPNIETSIPEFVGDYSGAIKSFTLTVAPGTPNEIVYTSDGSLGTNNLAFAINDIPGTDDFGVSLNGISDTHYQTDAGTSSFAFNGPTEIYGDAPSLSIGSSALVNHSFPSAHGSLSLTDGFQDWTHDLIVTSYSAQIAAVPEPSTYGLVGAGAAFTVAALRRRRKPAAANGNAPTSGALPTLDI